MNLPTISNGWQVIYADPPWRFATQSSKGRGRCPEGDIGARRPTRMFAAGATKRMGEQRKQTMEEV